MHKSLFEGWIWWHPCVVCTKQRSRRINFVRFIETAFEVRDADEDGEVLPYIETREFKSFAEGGGCAFAGESKGANGRRERTLAL
jgi:hypothetical protein